MLKKTVGAFRECAEEVSGIVFHLHAVEIGGESRVKGIGAGSIDTALNNYVALHYNAMQMSFLHCFYGIGVSISPYLLSFFLAESGGWRPGYKTMFAIQICIAVLALV